VEASSNHDEALKAEKAERCGSSEQFPIGGSKGAALAGASPDDLDESQGANTLEGDLENDVNAAGGIDKRESRTGSRAKRG